MGGYRIPDLPAGGHRLTVQHLGYASRTLHAVLPLSGTLRINVTLHPDPIPLAGIHVRGRTPLRGVEDRPPDPRPDRWMTLSAVRNHPLLAEPDVFLALGGGPVFMSPESPKGVHVRGGSSDQTSYLLDGFPVFNPFHVAGVFSAWNPDALASLSLSSAAPSPSSPEALSGTVLARTRPVGPEFRVQGGLSTSNARLTAESPLGIEGAGFLLSLRSGFPGGPTGIGEPSYIRGETGDGLLKVQWPVLGGEVLLMAFGSQNEIDAAADTQRPEALPPEHPRNVFRWDGRTLGAAWSLPIPSATLRARGWRSTARAGSYWAGSEETPMHLRSRRTDLGLVVETEGEFLGGSAAAGIRVEESRTSYLVRPEADGSAPLALAASTLLWAPFVRQALELGRRLEAEVAVSTPYFRGRGRMTPRVRLMWSPSEVLSLSGSYARSYQFTQSLRNAESVVGNVFPADLFIGAGQEGVPVASAHQGVLTLGLTPLPGVRLDAQGYLKASKNLLLVAPVEGNPFSTGSFAIGSGSTAGLSLEGGVGKSWYGLSASYGWQRVRLTYDETDFIPEWGGSHTLEAGAILFPTASSSLRIGITSVLGRRTTVVDGGLEWESCNLLDQGCEFGGSPTLGDHPRGGMQLPAYLRLDLGVEKHWHPRVAGREALLSVFGTVTNLLGRKNLLTFATDPSTGKRMSVEMRPVSPLVVGLDWRY